VVIAISIFVLYFLSFFFKLNQSINSNSAICLDEIKHGDSESLLCCHVYHSRCLNQELRQKCAVCRETKDNMLKIEQSEETQKKLNSSSGHHQVKRQKTKKEDEHDYVNQIFQRLQRDYQIALLMCEKIK
jgi:hypothetical protein